MNSTEGPHTASKGSMGGTKPRVQGTRSTNLRNRCSTQEYPEYWTPKYCEYSQHRTRYTPEIRPVLYDTYLVLP